MPSDFNNLSEKQKQAIINPSHYDVVPGYEYMHVMEWLLTPEEVCGHLKGQIFKYMIRLGKKDPVAQDLAKVQWYVNYKVDFLQRLAEGRVPYQPTDIE